MALIVVDREIDFSSATLRLFPKGIRSALDQRRERAAWRCSWESNRSWLYLFVVAYGLPGSSITNHFPQNVLSLSERVQTVRREDFAEQAKR